MPALPNVPLVLRVGIDWTLGIDAAAFDRLYYLYSGTAPSNATCATIASDIYTAAVTNLIPMCTPDRLLEKVTVLDLTTPTSGTGTHATPTAGTRSGNLLASNVCVLENSGIGRRYRGGKPRTYWPFGSETDLLNAQQWTGAAVTAFQSGIQAFHSALEAISVSGTALVNAVNVSYYHGFTAVTNPITGRTRDVPTVRGVALIDNVVTRSVNSNLGTQRRRTLIRH